MLLFKKKNLKVKRGLVLLLHPTRDVNRLGPLKQSSWLVKSKSSLSSAPYSGASSLAHELTNHSRARDFLFIYLFLINLHIFLQIFIFFDELRVKLMGSTSQASSTRGIEPPARLTSSSRPLAEF